MFTRQHIPIALGWLSAWFMLEMVFFGEPMYKYVSSPEGSTLYYVTICAVALIACVLACRGVARPSAGGNRAAVLISGITGSLTLVAIRIGVLFGPGPSPQFISLVACSVAFAWCATYLLGSLASLTMETVFTQGLRGTLCAVLTGIALSFLILPRFLRDGIYGETLVALSPLTIAIVVRACGSRPDTTSSTHDEKDGTVGARARHKAILSLVELAVLSLLMYLVSYFDYVAASVRVVVEENTYLYVAVLVLIAILIATLLLAKTERQLTTSVFLLLLFCIMAITLVAFFGVLTYVVYGGDYVYSLTKLLRRVVKIGMLFALVIILYQSSLPAAPAFLGMIVLPLVAGKLIQLTIAGVQTLYQPIAQHQYPYLVGIGFVVIILWSITIITHVQGSAILDAQTEDTDCPGPCKRGAVRSGDDTAQVSMMARTYGLTERETDVLGYLTAGYSLKAIAGRLCVSQNTVKTHVTGIYRKTGAHARQDIIDLFHSEQGEKDDTPGQ